MTPTMKIRDGHKEVIKARGGLDSLHHSLGATGAATHVQNVNINSLKKVGGRLMSRLLHNAHSSMEILLDWNCIYLNEILPHVLTDTRGEIWITRLIILPPKQYD